MFDEWFANLRKQGDIEVLDPALEAPSLEAPAPTTPATPNGSPGDHQGGLAPIFSEKGSQ